MMRSSFRRSSRGCKAHDAGKAKVTNSSNHDRIQKWRQSQGQAMAAGAPDDRAAASAPVSMPAPAPTAASASAPLSASAIPSRREEELAEQAALQAELDQGRLPSEQDIQNSMAESKRLRWWKQMRIRRRAATVISIPLAAAIFYGLLIAPTGKAVDSSFVIMKAGESRDSSQLAGIVGIGGGEGLSDAYRIREYLKSREAMMVMEKRYGFLTHFRTGTLDPFSRPFHMPVLGIDDHDFYKRKIHVGIDVREGIVRIEVEALTAKDATRFANGLLLLAKERTKNISDMLHRDQTASLEGDVRRAEGEMRAASNELAAAQRRSQEIDPQLAASTTYQLISSLQTTLVNRQAQRDSIMANQMTESPLLSRLDGEIASLKRQIAQHHAKLAGGGDRTVAAASSNLGPANTKLRLSQIGLEASLRTLEQANLNNIGQRRYLVVISNPVLPYDTLPKRLGELFGFGLILTLLGWGLARILPSALMGGRSS